MKKILALIAFVFVVVLAKAWWDGYVTVVPVEVKSLRIIPGKTLKLEVPDMGEVPPLKRILEVRVPEHYREDQPVPLLVWFSPGGGSASVRSVPPIVDFSRFLVVAIPYPGNTLPRLAIKKGKAEIDRFWAYEKPMLAYVRDLFPNISDQIRIAGGFSSGAHLVGSGLDRDWPGFTDFFTAYIIHEGGYAPEMTYRGMQKAHQVLVTYGLKNDSYGRVVVREMKRAGKTPTVKKLPHTGHSMSQEAIEVIREWISTVVLEG